MCDPETCLVELSVVLDEFGKTAPPPRRPGPAPSLWPGEVMTLAIISQWAHVRGHRAGP